MSSTRTTVVINDDLLKKTKEISKKTSTKDAIEFAMQELVRRESAKKLAAVLGTDDSFGLTPRRRPGSSE